MSLPSQPTVHYPTLLEHQNKIKLLEPFKGAKHHHEMLCLVCDHKWSATPLAKNQTFKKYGVSGCPNCNNIRKRANIEKGQQDVIIELRSKGILILSTISGPLQTTTMKLKFKNINCGHTFSSAPGNVINRGITCTICGKKERTKTITNWSKTNSANWNKTATEWQRYKSEVTMLTAQTYSKFKKKINPKNLPRGKAGIDGAYHLDHIVPKRFCFENDIPADVCSDFTNLQMIGWRDNVGSRDNIKGSIPHKMIQYIPDITRIERYVNMFKCINSNFIPHQSIHGITATLFDEINNVAILIIPTSKPFANQKSGIMALTAWEGTNLQYFIIFEDELADNFELITNKISHYTNNNSVERVHGRQCIIKEIQSSTKSDFLNKHHIQGNDKSSINIGAFYNEELVAVMTFAKPRVALGYTKKNITKDQWELSRFATNINYRIPGIASKLLTYFQRTYTWGEIVSYADKRWSVGNLYDVLGFTLTSNNPPGYHYVIDGKRKHRWGYRKDILKNTLSNYDSKLTEYQNMENNGFWRVWDCGTLRYCMT